MGEISSLRAKTEFIKYACALIWIFSLGLVFPPFVGWSKYVTEGIGTSCSWDYTSRDFRNRTYYIFLLVLGFFIPVAIIIVSYLGILYVVCKQSAITHRYSRTGGITKKNPTRSEVQTSKVVLSIIICFLVSWTPYAIISMIGQFGDASILSPLATALTALFAKASVICNPFVYSLSHPHFRTAFAALKAKYHIGKETSTAFSLNARYPHHYHNRQAGTRKAQLVVTAKGNRTYSSCRYNRNGYYVDGKKVQFDGFKGKIPTHMLRHFTGNNNPENGTNSKSGRCNKDVNTMGHSSATQRSKDTAIEQSATYDSSFSTMTSPPNSFRCKKKTKYLKKGVWIFKQTEGVHSESEVTAGTGVPTHYESSSAESDGVDINDGSSNRYKSILKRANAKDDNGFVKNSYKFFLCEYRKRRQKTIQETFFRSENCLTNNSFTKKLGASSSKSNTHDAGFGTQFEAVLVSEKTTLKNDYYDEDQVSKDKKFDEIDTIKASQLCVKSKRSDWNGESNNLVIRTIDTLHDHRNNSVEEQPQTKKNASMTFFCRESATTKGIPASTSFSCNNEFCSNHNSKHLKFIKEGQRSEKEGTTDTFFKSNYCPKVKQGNITKSFQMEKGEKEGTTGKILPTNISFRPSLRTNENVEEKVHEIVTGKGSTKLEDILAVRKSKSLSAITASTTESISPALVRIPMKNKKTIPLSSLDCNFHISNRDIERNSRMIGKGSFCKATTATAIGESIVASFRASEIDSSSSSWYHNNPNAISFSSHDLDFKEDDIDSQCSSESCYASCKSDLYSQSLEDLEMNSLEEYCLCHSSIPVKYSTHE